MKRVIPRPNKKAQATTELAIFGTIVIMLLAYLVQQGFIYTNRLGLEMYTFRKALEISRYGINGDSPHRGASLTVVRDIFSPSFFNSLNRQRIMASASVDYNPDRLWVSNKDNDDEDKDVPQDRATRQFIQVGDAMIGGQTSDGVSSIPKSGAGYLFEVPPTKVTIPTKDGSNGDWTTSAISEIDAQSTPVKVPDRRTSAYENKTVTSEDTKGIRIVKDLFSHDTVSLPIKFEVSDTIKANYTNEDWEHNITGAISVDNIPKDVTLNIDEQVTRRKDVTTPQP